MSVVVDGMTPLDPERAQENVLIEYYEKNDFLFSAEGILKVGSVIVCVAVSVVYLGAGGGAACGGPAPAAAAGALALAAGGVAALLYAGAALQLPLYAPQLWLFADIIISTVMGILLLVMAILSLVFCDSSNVTGFLRAPLGVLAAAMVVGSAGITYAEVTRRWDAAQPTREPPRPVPTEQEA